MKLRTKEMEEGQDLVFVPEDDLDIFLLGRIASKVERYEMKANSSTDNRKYCMTSVSIKTKDLLKLLERLIGGI